MTATTAEHSHDEAKTDLSESADFHSMREQDKSWSSGKLVVMLVVTLALALAFIYGVASIPRAIDGPSGGHAALHGLHPLFIASIGSH